jgi:tetratricopeptide (TPR) repeat protein
VRLADLYTLVGDHINALRYLNRAAVIDSTNPEILQLTARNLSWRGDVPGGLDAYWSLLSAAPNRLDSYLEAGKIAAWNGFYGASEQYYLAGLATFPENLQLRINLGFTYLWSAQESRANEVFQRTESAVDTVDDVLTVAREYRLNEEQERSRRFLERQLEASPGDAAISVELYDLLRSLNREEDALALAGEARAAAADPELLSALLARVDRTYELRAELIAEFEAAAAADPFNPAPRRTLAQTYLWTDRREEGITQFEYLLALEYLNGIRNRWDDAREFAERAALAAVVERDLRSSLRDLAADTAQLQAALSAAESIDEETTDEEAAAILKRAGDVAGSITVRRGRIESLIDFVAPRSAPPDGTPGSDGDPGTTDPLSSALASSRESWNAIDANSEWQPSLPRTRRELGLAQGAIPGVATTTGLLDWILGEDQIPPPPGLLVGTAAPIEQLLLTWAWATAGESAALERALTELPGDAAQLLLYRELYRDEEAPATAAPGSVAEAETLGQAAMEGLSELQRATAVALGSLAAERAAVMEVLQLETRSSLFDLQNESVALRSQLGRFYVESGDIPRGIAQFEAVQEVDPNNLDTLFSLAAAYQQQGLWARAMASYAAIYRQDPAYRNVASLHNTIARRNADEFRAGVRWVTEPTRVVFGSDLGYTWRVNSRMSVRLGFEATGTRLRLTSDGITRRQYFEQGRFLGSVPLSFLDGRLVLEPQAGLDFNGNQLFFATFDNQSLTVFADSPAENDGADFFQNWQFEPVVGLVARYAGGPAFLSLSYTYGPYRPAADLPLETALAVRPEYLSHTVGAGVSTDLAGSASPFWSRLRTSTGGSIDLISHGEEDAQRWTLQQDVQLALLARSEPYTRVAAGVSATFENYRNGEDGGSYDAFYRPDEVFQLGTHLGAELFRSISPEVTAGLIGRVYGGLYQTQLFDPGRPDLFELESGVRGAADLALELTRRDVAFQLGTSVSHVWDGDTDAEDYYSVGVTLTTIVRNPSLLVP